MKNTLPENEVSGCGENSRRGCRIREMTTAEKQVSLIEAVRLQRSALRLSRHAYLDELGAGELADAAARLEQAAFLCRLVVASVRRESREQLSDSRHEAA